MSSEYLGNVWEYLMKETMREHIEDFKLEVIGGFNVKELWAVPRESTALAFFFHVFTGTRASMLERHGGKCERGEKHTYWEKSET